jgi:hypothetical protein
MPIPSATFPTWDRRTGSRGDGDRAPLERVVVVDYVVCDTATPEV